MNVYKDEEQRQKYLERYFTEDGIKALEMRLKALTKLYVEQKKYPISATILGFPKAELFSKEHLEGMIENLKEILGIRQIEVDAKWE